MTNPSEKISSTTEKREGRALTARQIFERNRTEYFSVVKKSMMGEARDPDGGLLPDIDQSIEVQGLKNLTDNQFGHGATRVGTGETALAALFNALEKQSPFTGDFGPISGTEEAATNNYPTAWETGKFIITRNDDKFYASDGSLNIDGIEVILNATLSPFGKDLANTFPEETEKGSGTFFRKMIHFYK